jgi:TRAP-type transport system periplasmic protein
MICKGLERKMLKQVMNGMLSVFCASFALLGFAQNTTSGFTARELRVGIGLSEQHPQGRAVQFFSDAMRERTAGRWRVTLFGSGKLGNDATMVTDLQSGKLDFTVPDTSSLSKFEPAFGLINLPYEFDAEVEATDLLDGAFGRKLVEGLATQGLHGLGYWENGFRHITSSKAPIKAAADFRNLKLRVMQNPVFIDAFGALGASATPLPFPQLFQSLRSGTVDAQENPVITILNERFFEVQKYLTLTQHSYSAWVFLVSEKLWMQLSAEEKKLLEDVAVETRNFQRTLIRAESQNAISALRRNGMEVATLSELEMLRVRTLVREQTRSHKNKISRDWQMAFYFGRLNNLMKTPATK